ncbi:DUF3289 family protein [Flavobacterium mesophilum]|uniref:DUF3289 family protein n=1 Tax=Flavobacterium mesophilum TaxID=3143495 RepID=UPI0031DBD67D
MGRITIVAKNILEEALGTIRNDASHIVNRSGGKIIQNADKAINYNDKQDRQPPTNIRISKVEGPFDDNDKLVDKIELGKSYSFKATPTRKPSITEVALLKWAIKLDDNKKEIIGGVASLNKLEDSKITIAFKINHDFETGRIYAFYQKTDDSVSVTLSLKKLKFPILILQGSRRKGKRAIKVGDKIISTNETAPDMLHGDYPENEIGFNKLQNELYLEEYNKLIGKKNSVESSHSRAKYLAEDRLSQIKIFCKKSNDELFEIFKDKMWIYASGDIKTVVRDMVEKVRSNNGGEYTNQTLTNATIKHDNSIEFIKGVKDAIKEYLKSNSGKIDDLEIKDDSNGKIYKILLKNDIKSPKFDDNFSGLRIAMNDIWTYQIYITRYKTNGTNFEMGLEYIYYDHFGLDFPDIHKYDQDIFYVWFVLQHFRNFKPFITKIDIVGEFKGNI